MLTREHGQSLQANLLELISDEVRHWDNLAALHGARRGIHCQVDVLG
jgi:rubrerythrin